jgi:hypothetical protein
MQKVKIKNMDWLGKLTLCAYAFGSLLQGAIWVHNFILSAIGVHDKRSSIFFIINLASYNVIEYITFYFIFEM